MNKQFKAKWILFFIPATVNFLLAGSLFLPIPLTRKVMVGILVALGVWMLIISKVLMNPAKAKMESDVLRNVTKLE